MELEINGAKLRVYEDGKIEKWITHTGKNILKIPKWREIKGCICNLKPYNQSYQLISIQDKSFKWHRVVYKAFNPEWDINNSSSNNTIDHIDRNSLNNTITNLRVANMREQNQNQNRVINQKNYCWVISRKRWKTYIVINGKQKHVGYFMTEQEAQQAYLDAVAL